MWLNSKEQSENVQRYAVMGFCSARVRVRTDIGFNSKTLHP